MAELIWFEVHPPRTLVSEVLIRLLRVLAARPRLGLQRLTPLVCFELHLHPTGATWWLGMDQRMSGALPHELTGQMPDVALIRQTAPARPDVVTAREVNFDGLSFPLRLDTAGSVSRGLFQTSRLLRGREVAILQWLVGPSNDRRQQPPEFGALGALGLIERTPSTAEQQAWKAKVVEPLFGVRGRIGVVTPDARRAAVLLRTMLSALTLACGSHSPVRASAQSSRTARNLRWVVSRHRSWSSILNAAELAAVLGWPVDGATPTSDSLFLASVPPSLFTDGEQTERLLGRSTHPASRQRLVQLLSAASQSHLHLIGPTGSGKSTLLASLALADAAAGRAVVLIEPKGDLVDDVLTRLPRERRDDVVVLEPRDDGAVVGLNPLAGPREQAERRADELLALFRELFGSAIGPRSADVLMHALLTAARLPGGCLTDLPALLTNPAFRRSAIAQTTDPLVLGPFWAGFEALSESERSHVVAPLLNKLRVFTARAAMRRMLGQPEPQLSLDTVFSEKRILLVNLNRGLIGPETAQLLGSLLLLQLWRAIQRRAGIAATQRELAMVIIDEWQDYTAALDFADVLATARGLGVGVTVAHQHLSQLSPNLQAAVLANARSRVAFRPASRDLAALAAVLGEGVRAEDLDRLPSYHAAARVLIGAVPSSAFTVATLPLPRPVHSSASLRARAAGRYGADPAAIDAAMQERWSTASAPSSGAVGRRRRSS